jgi:hypothetical protein
LLLPSVLPLPSLVVVVVVVSVVLPPLVVPLLLSAAVVEVVLSPAGQETAEYTVSLGSSVALEGPSLELAVKPALALALEPAPTPALTRALPLLVLSSKRPYAA